MGFRCFPFFFSRGWNSGLQYMWNDVEGPEPLAIPCFSVKSFNIQHSTDYFNYLEEKIYIVYEECNNSEEGASDLEC